MEYRLMKSICIGFVVTIFITLISIVISLILPWHCLFEYIGVILPPLGVALIGWLVASFFKLNLFSQPFAISTRSEREKVFLDIIYNSRKEERLRESMRRAQCTGGEGVLKEKILLASYIFQLKRSTLGLVFVYLMLIFLSASFYLSSHRVLHDHIFVASDVSDCVACFILSLSRLVGSNPRLAYPSSDIMELAALIETLAGVFILGLLFSFVIIFGETSKVPTAAIFESCLLKWNSLRRYNGQQYVSYARVVSRAFRSKDIGLLEELIGPGKPFEKVYTSIIKGMQENNKKRRR